MNGKILLSNILLPALLAVLLILPHLPFLNNAYLDVEPIYVDAANRIATDGFNADLSAYYEIDANPLLTALIFAAAYRLFGESPFVSRITILLLSVAFIVFLYWYLKPRTGAFPAFLAALLVTVNPMFITYSQYVASDLDFMIFSSVTFLLLIFPYSSKATLASSVWFGVSLATKYAVLVLAPVIFLISVMRNRILTRFTRDGLLSLVRFNAWYFALGIIVALPIVLIVFRFQSSLMPLREVPITLSASMYLPRFFAYLIRLGLFLGPVSLVFALDLWERVGKTRFFILLVSLLALTGVVHLFYPLSSLVVEKQPLGSMSLAGFESAVPPFYLSIILFFVLLAAEFFVAHAIIETIDLWSSEDEPIKHILLWGLIPIPLMAVNQAVARYLLFVLVPISLYMAHVIGKMYSERGARLFVLAVLIVHTLIFLSVGFGSNYYLYQRGLAG